MAEFDEPRPVKRNLLLSTALLAVPVIAGIAIINDALPSSQANAAAVAPMVLESSAPAPSTDLAVAEAATETGEPQRPRANALIDATFAALPGDDVIAAVAADKAAEPQSQETSPPIETAFIDDDEAGAVPPGVSAVRKVKTTAIKVVPTEDGLSAIPDSAPVAAPAPLVPPAAAEPETVEVAALDVPDATPEVVDDVPAVVPEPRIERPVAVAKPEAPASKPEVAESKPATAAKGVRVGRQAVNARSGPSKSSGKVFVVDAGEAVKALETRQGWVRIADSGGREGWVYSDFLTGVDTKSLPVADAPKAKAPARAESRAAPVDVQVADVSDAPVQAASGSFTSTEHINVRSKPSASGGRLFVLSPGEQVTVTASSNGWSRIETTDGRSGWVYANVK